MGILMYSISFDISTIRIQDIWRFWILEIAGYIPFGRFTFSARNALIYKYNRRTVCAGDFWIDFVYKFVSTEVNK
jgi:hypothetical protein